MKQGIFKKISTFLLGSILALGVGVAVSAPHKDAMRADAGTASYVINFKDNGSTGDSTSKITSDYINNIIASGKDYVSSITTVSNVYNAKSGYGIKAGGSSALGKIVLSWNTTDYPVKPTSIVAKIAIYDNNKDLANGVLWGYNSSTTNAAKSGGATLTDYTVQLDGSTSLTSLTVQGYTTNNSRFYCKSITVNYEESSSAKVTSVNLAADNDDKELDLAIEDDSTVIRASVICEEEEIENPTVTFAAEPDDVVAMTGTGLSRTLTALKVGTTVITASYAGETGVYQASSETIEIVVVNSNIRVVTFVAGTDKSDTLTLTKDGISINLSNGSLNRTDNYRPYADSTMTIESSVGNISQILIACSSEGYNTLSADDYIKDGANGTWSGSSSSVTFSCVTQARINELSVYYELGETYTITYLKNDGSEDSTSNTGAAPEVLNCTFDREGYSFARWNTQADGEGTDYSVGATVSEDLTLYAIWQEYIAPIGGNVLMSEGENCTASTLTVGTEVKDAIKCGSGSKKGSMHLTFAKAGITKIKVYIAAWNGSSETLGINVTSENATVSPSSLTLTKDAGIQGAGTVTAYTLQGNETTYKFELTIAGGSTLDTDILISAKNASNNRFIVWGATDLFAEYFIGEFNNNITCDSTGEDAPEFVTDYNWTYFESMFNGLDAEEQGRIRSVTYTKSGSGASTVVNATGTTTQAFANAISRYDFIVAKYNPTLSSTSPWKDFIGRAPSASNAGKIAFGFLDNVNSGSTTSVILIISVISLATLGGTVLIRKRKEQE